MDILTTEFAIGVGSAVVTTVLIATSVYSWTKLKDAVQNRTAAKSVAKSTSKHVESFLWLVDRYSAEADSDLYVTQAVGPGTRLAFYSPTAWRTGPYRPDVLLDFSSYDYLSVPLDKKVLKKFGRRIPMTHADGSSWNDTILVARHVSPGATASLARSSYFEFLSSGGALQVELEEAMRMQHPRTPRRDRLVPRTRNFADGSLPLNPVGANVATILLIERDSQGPQEARVLLQVRADSVAVSPGLHNVVPSFGILAPVDGAARFDIRNDLIREYLEELLEYDDVIHTSQRKQASPYWYLGEPAARKLSAGFETGDNRFEILGMGVDLVHAGLHLACVLTVKSSRQELYELKANWEGRIFDIDLFSPQIDELVKSHAFQPDGAFAIDLARKHLEHLRP